MAQNLDELFQSAADQYGIPVGFLKSIAKQESGINVNVRDSDQGAQGIMQMLPQTAAAMGAKDPRDPSQAIPAAARYLAEGLAKTGSLGGAAAYYHGGPDQRQWGPKTSAYVQSVGNLYNKSAQGSTPSQPPRLVNVADALGYMGESAKPTAQDIWGGGSSSSPAPATPSTRVTAKDIWGAPEKGTDLSTPEQRAAYLKDKGLSADQPASSVKSFASGVATGVPILGPAFGAGANMAMGLQPGQAQADNPKTFLAGNLVGGAAPYVAAGNFPMAARALGMSAPAMTTQMVRGGISNALIGGTDALARGDNPGEGAAFGLAGGVGAPVVGGVVGGVVNKLMEGAQGLFIRPGIPGVGKASANMLSKFIQADDPAAVQAFLASHGDLAMLADAGPSVRGIAGGLAAEPSEAKSVVENALRQRAAGRDNRLMGDVNGALGPAPVPSQVTANIEDAQRALSPQYQQALAGASAVDTTPLANGLDAASANLRGEARQAAQRVRGFLNVPGTNELDPHPGALLETRHAIDGMLQTEQNPQVIRILSDARRQVDGHLTNAVPGIKDVDAQYQELARQGEGLAQGGQILDSGKTAIRPQELAQSFPDAANPAGTLVGPSATPLRIQQGARAEIDRLVGTKSNDLGALSTMLQGEGGWNTNKLATVFGEEPTNRLIGAVDRERAFQNTTNAVNGNSETARKQAAIDALKKTEPAGTSLMNATATGMAAQAAKAAILDPVIKMIMENPTAPRNLEMARILTAQGGDRDQMVNALIRYANRQGTVSGVGNTLNRLLGGGANRLLMGSSATLRP